MSISVATAKTVPSTPVEVDPKTQDHLSRIVGSYQHTLELQSKQAVEGEEASMQ
jgi:hypothetical protein